MTYYAVAKVKLKDDGWVPAYIENVTALVHKHGGKYLARTPQLEQLEGDTEKPDVFVILEWPSKEAAEAFYHDPAYKPYLDSRIAGSDSEFTILAGEDAMAS
ncbi:MAG: DUF1330 domain-containing protein [Pseudomonadota bacterium]